FPRPSRLMARPGRYALSPAGLAGRRNFPLGGHPVQNPTGACLSHRYGRSTSRDRLFEIETFSIKLGKLATKGIGGIATMRRFMGDSAHFFAKLLRLAQIRNRFK